MGLCIPLLTALPLALLGGGEGPDWTEYRDPAGVFRVSFPTDPTTKLVKTGDLESDTVTAPSDQTDGLVFMVQVQNVPKPFKSRRNAVTFLKGMEEGMVERANATVLESKEIAWMEVPGRELSLRLPSGQVMRCRLYVTNRKAISAFAVGASRSDVDSRESGQFFDSLQLLGTPEVGGGSDAEGGLAFQLGRATGSAAMIALVVFAVLFVLKKKKAAPPPDRGRLEDDGRYQGR